MEVNHLKDLLIKFSSDVIFNQELKKKNYEIKSYN